MKNFQTKNLILATFFMIGTAIGCLAEFYAFSAAGSKRSDSFDGNVLAILSYPGMLLSPFLYIGPHSSTTLFLWSWPLCNGVAYAGIAALAFWLRGRL